MDEGGAYRSDFKNNKRVFFNPMLARSLDCRNQQCPSHREGGTTWYTNEEEGSQSCERCGAVIDGILYDVDMEMYKAEYAWGTRNSQYIRVYHFHERWAQFLDQAPPAPVWLVYSINELLVNEAALQDKTPRDLAITIDSHEIKRYCRELRVAKFSERWVQIRHDIQRKHGVSSSRFLPSNEVMEWTNRAFVRASRVFDKILFRSNRGGAQSDHPRGRHNFLNYNFVFHQFFYMRGMRRQAECHFFFPLLKTARVLENLLQMWALIATELHWPYIATLAELSSPHYAFDLAYDQLPHVYLEAEPTIDSEIAESPDQ